MVSEFQAYRFLNFFIFRFPDIRPPLINLIFNSSRFHSGILNHFAADIRCHENHGVFEIHRFSLSVCQSAFIQNLKKNIEHVRMGFFNFVKQDHAIRFAPDKFGEIAAFLITHISRRRTDQPCYRMFFHVLGHVYAHHGLFVVKQKFCQRPGQLGFSHTCRPQKKERTDWTIGFLQTRTCPTNGVGHQSHSIVLPHHALSQSFFHF